MARGRSSSHATMRSILMAAAVATCCKCVFARAPIPRAPQPKGAHPLGERAFDPAARLIVLLALLTRIPGLGRVQRLGLRPGGSSGGAPAAGPACTTAARTGPAVLQAEAHMNGATARAPTCSRHAVETLALRTAHLLLLPIHRKLLEGIGPVDLRLPPWLGRVGPRRVILARRGCGRASPR